MFKKIAIFALFAVCSFSEELLTRSDGTQIIVKDDFTWSFSATAEANDTSEIKKPIKYAEEAVEVWDKSLTLTEVNYSNAVALYLHYLNKTDKKIIGVSVYVAIMNAFGKTVYQRTYEDEVVLEPNEKLKNDTYWHFDDNQFISGEPYDLMWQMAQNGTAKISASIRKVIFEDGTILTTKPKKK